MTSSQKLFKMLSICMQARSQSLSPLVNGRVNNVMLQTVPDINKALLQNMLVFKTRSVFAYSKQTAARFSRPHTWQALLPYHPSTTSSISDIHDNNLTYLCYCTLPKVAPRSSAWYS